MIKEALERIASQGTDGAYFASLLKTAVENAQMAFENYYGYRFVESAPDLTSTPEEESVEDGNISKPSAHDKARTSKRSAS